MTTELERKVMARVRTIYWSKRLMKPLFVRYELMILFFIVLGVSLDIPSIAANLLSATKAGGNPMYFLSSGFFQSLWLVKSVILVEMALVVFSLYDLVQKNFIAKLPRFRDARRIA